MESTFFVGYGTLLLRGSLGQTIGSEAASAREIVPVIVRGYKRLFNLRPTHYASSSKLTRGSIEGGAMNVEPAPGSRFNGLAFRVTEEELVALDRREPYYERRSVPIHEFESGEALGEGILYAAVPDAPWIERDPAKLLPLWRDVVWARSGAYRISEAFGRMYDETTYLADGCSLMVERYREVLEDTDDVEIPE